MTIKSIFLLFSFSLLFLNCKDKIEQNSTPDIEFFSSIPDVKTMMIKESSFNTVISSNGKLEAIKKIDLKFENEGVIERILVNDGQVVKKGQMIAYQSANYLESEKQKNEELLTKAKLDIEDILLGFGYSLKDSLKIPQDVFKMARSRSGIASANYQRKQTQKKYISTRILAPFSGVIANTTAKEKSLSSVSEKVCTLINNNELFVSFSILENEFGLIKKGDIIQIIPLALPNKKFEGKVKYINPIVNENGLIVIKAIITNRSNTLIDGMNVNITIEKKLNGVISVPKKAIVDRQNKKVIFTVKNGKSKWNYVEYYIETIDSVVVSKGLEIGDKIIIEGNINLAHGTEINLTE
jgi:RND family efflux transporter MFP subunit